MRLVKFSNLKLPLKKGVTVTRTGSISNVQNTARSREASIELKPSKSKVAVIIRCKRSGNYRGVRGNRVRFSVYYQTGTRYFMRFFDHLGNALGNSINTTSESSPTTAQAIVDKINGSAVYKDDFEAILVNNVTGAVFSDSSNVTFADSDPLTGGRGR